MRRFLLIAILCLGSLTGYARNPPEEWKAYRMARVTADGKSSQQRVQIWSDYLAKYPESPYRHRAIEELEEAAGGLWAPQPSPGASCEPDFDLNAALGVAGPAPLPALRPPDRLQAPIVSTKRPLGAGLRSLGATYGGALLGMALVNSPLGDDDLGVSAGLALWGTAMVVGPSAGHLYAGDKVHAKRLIAARAVAAGAVMLGFSQLSKSGSASCDAFSCESNGAVDSSYGSGVALLAVGLSTGTALVFYDLIDSFFVVQRKQGRPIKTRLSRPLGYAPGF